MGDLGTTGMYSGFSSDEPLLSDLSVQETIAFNNSFTLIKRLYAKAVTCLKLNRPPLLYLQSHPDSRP